MLSVDELRRLLVLSEWMRAVADVLSLTVDGDRDSVTSFYVGHASDLLREARESLAHIVPGVA